MTPDGSLITQLFDPLRCFLAHPSLRTLRGPAKKRALHSEANPKGLKHPIFQGVWLQIPATLWVLKYVSMTYFGLFGAPGQRWVFRTRDPIASGQGNALVLVEADGSFQATSGLWTPRRKTTYLSYCPKGPCTGMGSTWALKGLLYPYFGGSYVDHVDTWTLWAVWGLNSYQYDGARFVV